MIFGGIVCTALEATTCCDLVRVSHLRTSVAKLMVREVVDYSAVSLALHIAHDNFSVAVSLKRNSLLQ